MSAERQVEAKVAVIGAGSYVFSMGLLYDLIVDHRLHGLSLVLMDANEEMADVMARIARRMALEAGVEMEIEATGDREAALEEATFVTNSAAVDLRRRWEMDREVLHGHGISEVSSECGGVGGLSNTLRAVPLVLGLARDMERLCPEAPLLNVSNPLPRLITAVSLYTSIRAVGFCNVANGGPNGYENVARLTGYDAEDLDVVSAGLNHFSWLLRARDGESGKDLMPLIDEALAGGTFLDEPLGLECWRRYGYLPLAGDSHTGEFLPFDFVHQHERRAHHGGARERDARFEALHESAAGERPWEPLLEGRSWERPADAIRAILHGDELRLDMVNVPNRGFIQNLPNGAVVEVPGRIVDGELRGVRIGALPEAVASLCSEVAAAHTLAVEAAMTGDTELINAALEADPAITDKRAASAAIGELIEVHADLLPQFA